MKTNISLKILSLVIVIYFGLIVKISAQSDTTFANQQFLQAKQLTQSGKLDEPLILMDTVLKIYQKVFGKESVKAADVYFQKGLILYNQENYAAALANYNSALQIYQKNNKNLKVADCYHGIGNTQWWATGVNEDALSLFNKALESFYKKPDFSHERYGIFYNDIGHVYIWMGDYKKAEENIQKGLNSNKKYLGTHRYTALSYFMLSNLFKNLEDNFRQAKALEEAIQIYEKIYEEKGHPDFGAFYGELGNQWTSLGDFVKAMRYYKKAAKFMVPGSNNEFILKIAIGDCHRNLNNYQKSLKYYQEVLKKAKDNKRYFKVKNSAQFSIGRSKIDLGYYEEGWKILKEIEPDVKKNYGTGTYETGNFYEYGGSALIKAQKFDDADQYLSNAIAIYRDSLQQPNLRAIARCYNKIGTQWNILEKQDSAIHYFDKALNIIAPKGIPKERIIYAQEYMYTVWNKAEALNDIFEQSNSDGDAQKAYQVYQGLANYLDHYRKENYSENSISSFNKYNKIVYERLIHLGYLILENNHTESLKINLFAYAEKSKSTVLLQAVKNANVLQDDNLRDSLNFIKKGIAFYQQKNFEYPKSPTILEWESQLFDLNQEQEKLKRKIEKKYHLLNDLYSKKHLVTIEQIQQEILQPRQTLLEYFLTSSDIYFFVIQKNKYEIRKIIKTPKLEDWINNLRNSIYQDRITGALKFSECAFSLYQNLIKPVEDILTEKILLVPDGKIGYIPFDALISNNPRKAIRFATHNYLIYQYQFNYTYSASLLKELKDKNIPIGRKPWLGMAPSFEESSITMTTQYPELSKTRKGFGKLKYNIDEVLKIDSLINGDYRIGSKATESTFNELVRNYKIIHLATHAVANDTLGDFSFLVFYESNDSTENEILYAKDLYAIQLQAELVVLSACETGIGEIQEGEGIISLARGFSYAGAKSIVTTLWNVDDEATKNIMVDFYKNLIQKNWQKDQALRKAKLNYLKSLPKNDHNRSHPYFWSGIIFIGDNNKIDFQ